MVNRLCISARPVLPGTRAAGFTLIEAMITLVVLGILMAIAAPSFNDMLSSNRLRNASYEMLASLNYARSEAIKRNADVSVTPSAAGWSSGWTIETAGIANPLKTVEIAAGSASIGAIADGAPFNDPVTYQRNGRVSGFNELRFTIRLTDLADDRFVRCIYVDFGGRASMQSDSNQDGDCSNG